MSGPLRKAVFLDRDGTLNEECHYLHRPEDWHWLPGVVQGLALLQQAGFMLIVITNQSGIARGYYKEEDMLALHTWVNAQLAVEGVNITDFYHCPHHPDFSPSSCHCRKPSPLLLQEAARQHHIDLGASWMIGDKMLDVRAGKAAGCTSILVQSGYGQAQTVQLGNQGLLAKDFLQAVALILD